MEFQDDDLVMFSNYEIYKRSLGIWYNVADRDDVMNHYSDGSMEKMILQNGGDYYRKMN